MKRLAYISILILLASCTTNDNDPGENNAGDITDYKYITITNGDSTDNLYLAGMIGLSPGKTSDQIKLYTDKKDILYKWSGKDYSKIIWDTLHIDLSNTEKFKGKNFILKK